MKNLMGRNMTEGKPVPGDVIYTNRGLYKHYGIYIGNETVVHFTGGKKHEISSDHAFVRKTQLGRFLKGGTLTIETKTKVSYTPKETVMRALSAVGSGKGKYHLIFNNCEHFANWCKYGKCESKQVKYVTTGLMCIAAIGISAALIGAIANDEGI
ncbi:lecithin retinol acyltransferase family protein [Treponema socranskii]|uniref:lecithin retinol acyltransferase family protein n=1 Tax=Treponema socranskii TaxID=53419 RepID=UPI003D6E3A78